MNILALDLATRTGFAHTDGTSGVWVLPPGKNGTRWKMFRNWLDTLLACNPTDLIVAEASLHQPGLAGRMANAMHTIIEMSCDTYGCDYKRVAASTLKKYATGNGRATKPEMYEAAKKRGLTVNVESDDHVDALWLLHYAVSEL